MRRIVNRSAAALLFAVALSVVAYKFNSSEQVEPVKTHVTIYIDPMIADQGGVVIVAARSVSEQEWRQMREGLNPAQDDPSNPKRAQIGTGDQHFGVSVHAPVSVVEFFYPDSGGYSFNLRSVRDASLDKLQTKKVLDGTGRAADPVTRKEVEWRASSVIQIIGPDYDEYRARLAGMTINDALSEGGKDEMSIRNFQGARVIELHSSAIEKYIVDTK